MKYKSKKVEKVSYIKYFAGIYLTSIILTIIKSLKGFTTVPLIKPDKMVVLPVKQS